MIRSSHRYFPPEELTSFLEKQDSAVFTRRTIGQSVDGLPIHLLHYGSGPKKVLIWSQMHGNEATTTRALCDLLEWLPPQQGLQEILSLQIIPQLNPDGALLYTRKNSNGIDLNRDAVICSQPESKILNCIFRAWQPHYCFNLHDQRTIYGVGQTTVPATLSFLSPAADAKRSITPERERAMQLIGSIVKSFEGSFQQRVGRYEDTFNPNCVGDAFTAQKAVTLLFEAGHYPNDYERIHTRKHVLNALKIALQNIASETYIDQSVEAYFGIPENTKSFVDVIVEGVSLVFEGKTYKDQQLALQFVEKVSKNKIHFTPHFFDFGEALLLKAHQRVAASILLEETPVFFEKEKSATKYFKSNIFSTQ